MSTVGAFLKQKLCNMAHWIEDTVGRENLPLDVVASVADRSEFECTLLAQAVADKPEVVLHSDWSGLVRLLEENSCPAELSAIVQAVRTREAMHEKFWRYMALFRDTISNTE